MDTNTNILQAVDIITDSKIKGLKFDKTIIGNISKIEDIEEGRYRIEYETGNFVVYSEDPTITYGLGESVYVKIPEGDYSNKKFIEGKVINEEKSQIGLELKNSIIYADRSFEFIKLENTETWMPKDEDIVSFNNYIKVYKGKMIKVTADFKGVAADQGNYGIAIYLAGGQADENDTINPNAVLDITEMSGDPFNRPQAVPQSIYIPISQDIILKDTTKIDFINENTNTENPMKVEKILVEFCEVVDFSTVEYYAQINPIDGLYVIPGQIDEIELVGKLYHLGIDVTDVATGFQWYKETSYDPYPEQPDEEAESLEQKERIDWVAIDNGNTANLKIKEQGQARYKLIAYYKERKSVEQIITINPTDDYIITMDWTKQEMTINASENDEITWYVYNYNNELVAKGIGNKYIIESSYAYISIKCKIKTSEEVIHIISLISKRPTYSASIDFEGKDLFHYNAASNIDEEIYKQEYTLTPKLLVNEQIEKITWSLCDLQVESENYVFQDIMQGEVYNIASSMVKNIWVDGDNKLHYSIDEIYNLQKWNNTFKIKIDTIKQDGTKGTYYSQRDIIFIRDGQQGTNGTGYCFVVRPCTQDGVLLGEDEAFVAPGNEGILYLRPFVYYNNDLIVEDIDMEWTFPRNSDFENQNLKEKWSINDYFGIKLKDSKINSPNYLYITARAKVNIKNSNEKIDNFQILYYNYPISTINSTEYISKVQTLIAPKYVEYVVNGANPEWLNKDIYCQIDDDNAEITSGNSGLLRIKQIEGKNKLYPASNFNFKNGIGYLIFKHSDVKIYYPIMMYLNIFGNEAINDWNGTEIYLNDKNRSILAPQVGAGQKNDDNTFTGIIMGQDYGQEEKIGLYGYNNSNLTLGLDQFGNAFFGLNKEVNFDVVENKYTIGGWVLNRNNLYSQKIKKDENNTDIVTHEVYLYSGQIEGATTNRTHTTYKLISREIGRDENNQPVYGDEKIIAQNNPDSISSAIKCDLFYATKYGQIGGWIMNENELFSQQCQSTDGRPLTEDKVPGTYPNTVLDGKSGIITTKYFKVFETKQDGDGGNVKGQIGYIGGNDGTNNTATLGIESKENSIVLQSGKNIRISAGVKYKDTQIPSSGLYLEANGSIAFQIIKDTNDNYNTNKIDLLGWQYRQYKQKIEQDSIILNNFLYNSTGQIYCQQLGIGKITVPENSLNQICNVETGWNINTNEIKHSSGIFTISCTEDSLSYMKITNETKTKTETKPEPESVTIWEDGGIQATRAIVIGGKTGTSTSTKITNNAMYLDKTEGNTVTNLFYIDEQGMNIGSDITFNRETGLIQANNLHINGTINANNLTLQSQGLEDLADAVADKVLDKIKKQQEEGII